MFKNFDWIECLISSCFIFLFFVIIIDFGEYFLEVKEHKELVKSGKMMGRDSYRLVCMEKNGQKILSDLDAYCSIKWEEYKEEKMKGKKLQNIRW